MQTVAVADGDRPRCAATGPTARETYAVPLPAVVSVMEGGVEPRYPTITGRMKAKKVAGRDARAAARAPRAAAGCG